MEKTSLPRGIRNNNPLNIRIGNHWKGEVEEPTDKEFEQFTNIIYGLRAGFILLRRYIKRYGLNTVHDIISRWAPASENNTTHYIMVVSSNMGVDILDELSFEDEETMVSLVSAMCLVECGCTVEKDIIRKAYQYACGRFSI